MSYGYYSRNIHSYNNSDNPDNPAGTGHSQGGGRSALDRRKRNGHKGGIGELKNNVRGVGESKGMDMSSKQRVETP